MADLDMTEAVRGKYDFDVPGYYARPDVFQLHVNERETPAVVTTGEESQACKMDKDDTAGEYK